MSISPLLMMTWGPAQAQNRKVSGLSPSLARELLVTLHLLPNCFLISSEDFSHGVWFLLPKQVKMSRFYLFPFSLTFLLSLTCTHAHTRTHAHMRSHNKKSISISITHWNNNGSFFIPPHPPSLSLTSTNFLSHSHLSLFLARTLSRVTWSQDFIDSYPRLVFHSLYLLFLSFFSPN